MTHDELKQTRAVAENWPKYAKSEIEPDTVMLSLLDEVDRLCDERDRLRAAIKTFLGEHLYRTNDVTEKGPVTYVPVADLHELRDEALGEA